MAQSDQTVNVRMAEEFVSDIEECVDARGFSNRSEFIRAAVRDAINASNPYREDAQEQMEAVREEYEQGSGQPVDELFGEVGIDIPENNGDSADFDDLIYDQDEDTWTDETDVTIVGLGGAGARIVTQLHTDGLDEADTVIIDTDESTISQSVATSRLYLELGELADETSTSQEDQISDVIERSQESMQEELFDGTDLVFIISGIGGAAGTVLTPHVSEVAARSGAVVTTIATLPHTLEGEQRRQARDDIEIFEDTSDTFVLVDAARFAEGEPELAPGEVFDRINQSLVTALRQMLLHREYIGNTDETDAQGLANIFRDGGYATLAAATATGDPDVDDLRNRLSRRSLVGNGDGTTGALVHLLRINMAHLSRGSVEELISMLLEEASGVSANPSSINIASDPNMDDGVRITSIITGLSLTLDEMIESPEEADNDVSGRFRLMADNTAAEQLEEASSVETPADPTLATAD